MRPLTTWVRPHSFPLRLQRRCVVTYATAGARQSPYDVLGVSSSSSLSEVKSKFYQQARVWHPDMPGGSHAKFQQLQAAYRIIVAERASPHPAPTKPTGAEEEPASPPAQEAADLSSLLSKPLQKLIGISAAFLLVAVGTFSVFARRRSSDQVSGAEDAAISIPQPVVNAEGRCFNTLREYFDFYDSCFPAQPTPNTTRSLAVSRLNAEQLDEAALSQCCPVLIRFNSNSPNCLPGVASELKGCVQEKQWKHPDLPAAVALVVDAMVATPSHHASHHRVTTVEYQSPRDKLAKCAVAMINDRYREGTGTVQRIIVGGDGARTTSGLGVDRARVDAVEGRSLPIKIASL